VKFRSVYCGNCRTRFKPDTLMNYRVVLGIAKEITPTTTGIVSVSHQSGPRCDTPDCNATLPKGTPIVLVTEWDTDEQTPLRWESVYMTRVDIDEWKTIQRRVNVVNVKARNWSKEPEPKPTH